MEMRLSAACARTFLAEDKTYQVRGMPPRLGLWYQGRRVCRAVGGRPRRSVDSVQ